MGGDSGGQHAGDSPSMRFPHPYRGTLTPARRTQGEGIADGAKTRRGDKRHGSAVTIAQSPNDAAGIRWPAPACASTAVRSGGIALLMLVVRGRGKLRVRSCPAHPFNTVAGCRYMGAGNNLALQASAPMEKAGTLEVAGVGALAAAPVEHRRQF